MSRGKMPGVDAAYIIGNGYVAENELMRAIILRVIEDLKKGGEFKEDAVAFLDSDDDEYVFSFRSICGHLGFDPGKTRAAIIAAIDEGRRISTRRRAA
jgi:hypothetical protein